MASMWDPSGRRSSIQIIRDMLDVVRLAEPNKTMIMSTVNLSYTQIQKYICWLSKSGMLEVVSTRDDCASYIITEKGLRLLFALNSLREMLRRKETSTLLKTADFAGAATQT